MRDLEESTKTTSSSADHRPRMVERTDMIEWTTESGPAARAVPIGDPPPMPMASLDDIAYARRLRLELRERYPDRPDRVAPSAWSIDVD